MERPFSSFLITCAIPKSQIFGDGIAPGTLAVIRMLSGWGAVFEIRGRKNCPGESERLGSVVAGGGELPRNF